MNVWSGQTTSVYDKTMGFKNIFFLLFFTNIEIFKASLHLLSKTLQHFMQLSHYIRVAHSSMAEHHFALGEIEQTWD